MMRATKPTDSRRVHWRTWVSLVWLVYGLLSAGQIYLLLELRGEQPVQWYGPLAISVVKAGLWALYTPFIVALAQRFPFRNAHWPRSLAVHFVFLALTLALDALADALLLWLIRGAWPQQMLAASLQRVDVVVFYYFVAVLATHLARYYLTARSAELAASDLSGQLAQSQLQLLKTQIRPHFLFNALNVISELTREDPARASIMIEKLGELLRMSLEHGSGQTVALRSELRLIELYLDVQQTRFEELLQPELDVDPAVLEMEVPALLLQPLVENAIQHGILPARRPCRLIVSAQLVADRLELRVRDTGVGLKSAPDALQKRIGLRNTEARLARLYGSEYEFGIRSVAPHGTEVIITIPRVAVRERNSSAV